MTIDCGDWFLFLFADRDSYWGWIDPGAISFLGAASFFGGVSRLSMALTVIMVSPFYFCFIL